MDKEHLLELEKKYESVGAHAIHQMNIGFFQGDGLGSLMSLLSILFSKAKHEEKEKSYLVPDKILDMAKSSYQRTQVIVESFSKAQTIFQDTKESTEAITVNEFYNILKSQADSLNEALARKKQTMIIADLDEGLKEKTIIFDKNRMSTALNEVILNAIKYSKEEDEIDIAFSLENDGFVMQMLNKAYANDDGSYGIEGVNEKLVFEPFFRLAFTMDDKYIDFEEFSFGLGLPIVKKILTLNKASISLKTVKNFVPQRETDVCTKIQFSLV